MCQRCLALVEHDLQVLKLLSNAAASQTPKSDVSDWKCTLLFYLACIYVRAYAHQKNKDIQRHLEARDWLNFEPGLIPIARSYRKLEERSRDARYEGRKFSTPEIGENLRWFQDVRDRLVSLLSDSGLANVPRVDPQPWL